MATPDEVGSQPGTPQDQATSQWSGPSTAALSALAQHICRVRNRRKLFGGKREDVIALGAPGMCGLVVGEILKFLRNQKLPDVPSQQSLAELVNVRPGALGHFLSGAPRGEERWLEHAYKLVRYILFGNTLPADADKVEIITRIEEYFFRDFEHGGEEPPPFFHPIRARFGEPYSLSELAGEVEWLAVQQGMTGRKSKLVWVSADTTFFPTDGDSDRCGKAIRDSFEAGVAMRFVHLGPSAASRSLEELFNERNMSTGSNLRRIDLATPPPASLPARWWEFFTPAIQFLFLSIPGDDPRHPDESLFILRSYNTQEYLTRHMPIALSPSKAELQAFKSWLNRMAPMLEWTDP